MICREPYIFTGTEYVRSGSKCYWIGFCAGMLAGALPWIELGKHLARTVTP